MEWSLDGPLPKMCPGELNRGYAETKYFFKKSKPSNDKKMVGDITL
jgi:hypothetical protein